MNELRKPHDSAGGEETGEGSDEIQKEIVPEPRILEGTETAEPDAEKQEESNNGDADEGAEEGKSDDDAVGTTVETVSSEKSLQPTQGSRQFP